MVRAWLADGSRGRRWTSDKGGLSMDGAYGEDAATEYALPLLWPYRGRVAGRREGGGG